MQFLWGLVSPVSSSDGADNDQYSFRLDNYMNAQDSKVVLLVYTYEIWLPASKKEYEIWCHGFHDGLYSMIKCLLVININSSPWHQRTVRWTPHGAAAAAAWRPSVGAFASIWSHLHPHPAANDCFLLSFRLNAAERQEIYRPCLTQTFSPLPLRECIYVQRTLGFRSPRPLLPWDREMDVHVHTPVKSHSSNKMLFSFCLFTLAKFTSNYMHHYKQLSQTTRASFSSKPRMHGNQSAIHFIRNAETCCNYTIHMLHTIANQCGGKNRENFIHTKSQEHNQTSWNNPRTSRQATCVKLLQMLMHLALAMFGESVTLCELLHFGDDSSAGLRFGDSGGTGEIGSLSSPEFSSTTGSNMFSASITLLSSSGSSSSTSPSSKETTSWVANWWKSTISRRKRFSRAYVEFSCASLDFSASNVSSCTRICFSFKDKYFSISWNG